MLLLTLLTSLIAGTAHAAYLRRMHNLPLPHILDPRNTDRLEHGIIINPKRMVVKLDCADCPIYNSSWDSEGTALIYDFAITPFPSTDSSFDESITLNKGRFYPSRTPVGSTSFIAGNAIPIPLDYVKKPIGSYLHDPSQHPTTRLVHSLEAYPVPNAHDWDITCILLHTSAYGQGDNVFENGWGNISTIKVFFQRQNMSKHKTDDGPLELREMGVQEKWTLEWWQIMPMEVLAMGEGFLDNGTALEMPIGLENKLLGERVEEESEVQTRWHIHCRYDHKIGPWNALQVWMLAATVMAAVVGLAYLSVWIMKTVKRAIGLCIDYVPQKCGRWFRLEYYDAYVNEQPGAGVDTVCIRLE